MRARIEADKEYKNKSANDLKKEQILGITLLERLLMEPDYYVETKKHLDRKSITLCAGSRISDGNVPYVHWNVEDGELYVHWGNPDRRYGFLRTRAVGSA